MKFNVSSSILYQTLQNASKVLSAKNAIPLLEYFLFEINGNKLRITASDSEIILRSVVNIVNEDGIDVQFAVSSKRLLDSMKELSEQPLTFDVDTDNWDILLIWSSGNLTLTGMSADGYPEIKSFDGEFNELSIPCTYLDAGFSSTVFAADGTNTLRPVMSGVLVELEENHITFVATNAQHLAKYEVTIDGTIAEKVSLIIPAKAVNVIRTICQKETEDAVLQYDARNIVFKIGGSILISRLIEGNYPRYRQVIPQNNPRRAIANRAAMLSTVRRVSVCAPASGLMMLSFTSDHVKAKCSDVGFGLYAEDVLAIQYNDEPLDIGFRAQYLIEALSAMQSEDVEILLADETRPGLITPVQHPDDEDFVLVLMPIALT